MVKRAGDAFKQSIGDVQSWTNASRMFVTTGVSPIFRAMERKPEDGYGITPINNQLYLLLICCVLRDCGHSDEMLSQS